MSLKSLKSKSDDALASIVTRAPDNKAVSRPVTSPGATAFMQSTIAELEERARYAELQVAELMQRLKAQPVDIAVDGLIEIPGRRRHMAPDEFLQLTENLRHNPLVHAIAVFLREDGQYEIVSGHHRVDAFKLLGRKLIPAICVNIEIALADRTAFFANLFQSSLTDYEKFAGFRQERERSKLPQKELARISGISESALSMLFTFEKLPQEALRLINTNPACIGMSCAAELSKLARAGRDGQVTEVIELLVDGKITQTEAVRRASRSAQTPRLRWSEKPTKIRAGRLEFCEYSIRGNSLRIDFRSEDLRMEAEAAITDVLQKVAEKMKEEFKV